MSKLYKKETVTKTVTEKILLSTRCDVCGHEIPKGTKYWRLTTSHGDWGNDSCESFEHFDLCSLGCIQTKLNHYLHECEGSYTQEFDLTQAYDKKEGATE